jgi:hypothetical protein
MLHTFVDYDTRFAYIPDDVWEFLISLSVLVLTPCRFLLTEHSLSSLGHSLRMTQGSAGAAKSAARLNKLHYASPIQTQSFTHS